MFSTYPPNFVNSPSGPRQGLPEYRIPPKTGMRKGAGTMPAPQSVDKVNDLQTLKKTARQGSKVANKGAYTNVSDRNLQPPLTR